MTPPITATRPRTLGACTACLLAQPHTIHDTSLPVATRTSITIHTPRKPDPDIGGYLTEAVPNYPAI